MNATKKMIMWSNWKIYMKSRKDVRDYVEKIRENLKSFDSSILEIHIMTDFLSFEYVKKNLADMSIKVGVQDLFWEDSGSFAGEVSPLMLKDLGCDSAYIGHSERKNLFFESDENVNRKVHACLRNGIAPMMFIGETSEELEKGMTEHILRKQLRIGLNGVMPEDLERIIIIYEPRWAIGCKDSASLETIQTMHKKTILLLSEVYDKEIVAQVRILYGGSVNLENIQGIVSIDEVDGAGAARASIDPLNFIKLIRIVETEAKKREGSRYGQI